MIKVPQKGNSTFTNSGIINLFKQFSKKEISDFEKFIRSPFYNNHSTLINLFRELKKYYPEFNNKKLTKENLFSKVNNEKRYDDVLFRKYISNLTKLAEEYLNVIEIRLQKEKGDLNILNQLFRRNLIELLEKKIKIIEKRYKYNNDFYEDYYFNKHILHKIKYNNYSANNKTELVYENVVSSQSNLINYFLFNSLTDFKILQTQKYTFKISDELNSIEIFYKCFDFKKFILLLKDVKGLSEKESNLLELYYLDYQLSQSKNDPDNYFKFKSKISECEKYLSKNLLYFYISQLNLYCLMEIAYGRNELERELFENYKSMLERDLFSDESAGRMNLSEYRAILNAAIRVKEIDWAEFFINRYRNYIIENERENVFNYGYALLLFEKKDYIKSLNLLTKVKMNSFVYSVDSYVLRFGIYYELNYFDTAVSLVDSFRHYIRNNKILSADISHKYNNFLRYYKKLLKLKKNPEYTEINNFKHMLEEEKITLKKKWMLEKAGELLIQ